MQIDSGDIAPHHQIMVDLRVLFDEHHDRLAERIEKAMSREHQQILERFFRGELAYSHESYQETKEPGIPFSAEARNSVGLIDPYIVDGTGNAEDLEFDGSANISNIASSSSNHPPMSQVLSRRAEAIDEVVKNFRMQEVEDDELQKKAKTVSEDVMPKPSRDSVAAFATSKYTWRRSLQVFFGGMTYEIFIGVLILVNAIYIGCELEYMVRKKLQESPLPLRIANHAFTAIFTLELAGRILAEGPAFVNEPSRRAWNWIDSFLVIFSLLESGVDIYQSTLDDKVEGVNQLGSIRAIRVIRISRLLRIFRVARIVRFVRALRTLIYSIVCTLKSLAWAMLLLLIIVYVFALVFTQAATDHLMEIGFYSTASSPQTCSSTDPLGGEYSCVLDLYWGSLSSSVSTLYKAIAGGISWDVVVQPLNKVNPVWDLIFTGYISFTYLAVLNVVTGVFCQSAIEGAQHDHDLLVQAQIKNKEVHVRRIKELFQTIDTDNSGVVTFNELAEHIDNREVKAFLDSMELDTQDAWTLFKLLDIDQTHEIEIEDFVEGILRLKGLARSVDMSKLLHEMKWLVQNVKNLFNYVHLEMTRLNQLSAEGCLAVKSASTTSAEKTRRSATGD